MKALHALSELDGVFRDERALLFKHSTICPISGEARREVEVFLRAHPDLPAYLVRVIEERSVSNDIARRTGVIHESPQAFLLGRGHVLWHGSHHDVTEWTLTRELKKALERPFPT